MAPDFGPCFVFPYCLGFTGFLRPTTHQCLGRDTDADTDTDTGHKTRDSNTDADMDTELGIHSVTSASVIQWEPLGSDAVDTESLRDILDIRDKRDMRD